MTQLITTQLTTNQTMMNIWVAKNAELAASLQPISTTTSQCARAIRHLSDADLSGSDLSGANLSGARLFETNLSETILFNASGNKEEVKSLSVDRYSICYTADRLQVGCKNFAIEEKWNFSDEKIEKMDSGSLEFWRKWKLIIKQIIEVSPATPTGFEQKEGK